MRFLPSPKNEPLKDPLNIPSPVEANEAVVASSACEAVVAVLAIDAVPVVCEDVVAVSAC